MVPLAFALGVVAAVRASRWPDLLISGSTLGVIAVPEFVIGTVLVLIFSVSQGWLPSVSIVPPGESPLATPEVLVLPVATLLLAGLAYMIRMVRAGMVEVMASDYVEMARLNGVAERRVVWRFALRNALAPSVQALALTLQWLVGGVVIIEVLFAYPGIGEGLVQAVTARDVTLIQSVATIIALFYIAVNVVADVLIVLLIPKLRTAQ
jgi:peptide/nickel transport system permease protein